MNIKCTNHKVQFKNSFTNSILVGSLSLSHQHSPCPLSFEIQQEQHPEAGLSGRIGKHKNLFLFRLEVHELQKSTKKATRIQKNPRHELGNTGRIKRIQKQAGNTQRGITGWINTHFDKGQKEPETRYTHRDTRMANQGAEEQNTAVTNHDKTRK